jgi:hypothetical protein
MSFAIAPVEVEGRRVKLYVADEDMLRLLQIKDGNACDFLQLVTAYISHRKARQDWSAPPPGLIQWIETLGHRPLFAPAQVGLHLPLD